MFNTVVKEIYHPPQRSPKKGDDVHMVNQKGVIYYELLENNVIDLNKYFSQLQAAISDKCL